MILPTSLVISSSVTKIGREAFGAFRGCKNLVSIVVSESNPVYDSRNNCNAIIETASNSLILGCRNTVIPDTVTKISGDAFFGGTAPSDITFPESVTVIGSDSDILGDIGAFKDCEFEKSFCHYDESSKPSKPVYVEYDSQEDLIQEILKYADKFAKVALEQNESFPAYNVFVSVNEWETGEQYSADDAIEVIEE